MNLSRLIICFLFFSLSGCKDSRSEIDKISDHFLCQLAKQMRTKGLIAIGSGGGCTIDKKINLISMTFEFKNILTLDQARQLLVESVQALLILMNEDPSKKKYFESFPVSEKIISISIFGEECPNDLECIDAVSIIKGKVYYYANNPMIRYSPYLDLKEETFEEAQKIVALQATQPLN